jgi:hypothetical protein
MLIIPILALFLPYVGFVSAALAVFAFFRDMRRDVSDIKTNHLPHLLEATQDQTKELREMRSDFRTYFAKDGGVTVTVSGNNKAESR